MKLLRIGVAVWLAIVTPGLGVAGGEDAEAGLRAFRSGDYATARLHWQSAAEAGDASAQFNLGMLHFRGLGVERNYAEAARWYRQSAEGGFARAQMALADLYAMGRGITRDEAAACRWYERAARQGLPQAQYRAGLARETGAGCRASEDAAIDWFRRAALQDFAPAKLQLALLLRERARRSPEIAGEAIHWFTRAAEDGSFFAQYVLGRWFQTGDGVPRDPAEAESWLRLAAENDLADAQFELGRLLWNGAGVPHRAPESRRWLAAAAEQGHEAAAVMLEANRRLRGYHLRQGRFMVSAGTAETIRTPSEIRRGPQAPVTLDPETDVFCELFLRDNQGGNPKFRCFMTTPPDQGSRYYDVFGRVRDDATGVVMLDDDGDTRPVLARDGVPLTYRTAFREHLLPPLELKVKYASTEDPDPVGDRDMYTEVAATRLLWTLGFAVDRMYRVRRVVCHRCSEDPFRQAEMAAEETRHAFDGAAVELKFGGESVTRADDTYDGGWSWGNEIWRLRYGLGVDGYSRERKSQLDALLLMLGLVHSPSARPEQNRLVCARSTMQRVGEWRLCPDTVLLVHDLGAVFGKRHVDSLQRWRQMPIWADPDDCRLGLRLIAIGDELHYPYVISAEGQQLALDLLDQLGDDHLSALFEASSFDRYTLDVTAPGEDASPERRREVIDLWVQAFREKVTSIRSATCPPL